MRARNLPWIFLAINAIGVGVYPFVFYYLLGMGDKGLLQNKPAELLTNPVWRIAFYTHITFGGLALLTGWSQFNSNWRNKYLQTHRWLGRVYLLSVLFSSVAGLYLAVFATGGIGNVAGFGALALLWLASAIQAYSYILKGDIDCHQDWMTINYSLTFAAVTLRIWLPILQYHVFHEFLPAYRIVAWLSWAPNVLVALLIIRGRRRRVAIKA